MNYLFCGKDYQNEFESAFKNAGRADYRFIQNEFEFSSLEPQKEDIFFILAELQWAEEDRAAAYKGFEVIKEIRYFKQWLNPAVIYAASSPKSFFLEQSGIQFRVLDLPHSHHLLEFSIEKEDIEYLLGFDSPLIPLTHNQLKDFIYHTSRTRGLMDEALHRLKDQINSRGVEAVTETFNHIRNLVRNDAIFSLGRLEAEMLERVSIAPEKGIGLVSEFKPRIIELLPQEAQEGQIKIQVPWQVLFIDDNEDFRKLVQSNLEASGLSCITAKSGEEAFQILNQDAKAQLPLPKQTGTWPAHSITVLISDLRLFKPGSRREWQALQGYDIIEKIFEDFSHFLSFFILTGKKTGVYQEYAQSKVRVQWFAKEDVLPPDAPISTFNSFVRQIEKAGNSIEEILCSVPSKGYWNSPYEQKIKFPLKNYYRYHRLSSDYFEQENRLNAAAAAFVEDTMQDKAKPQKYQFQTGHSKGPEFPDEMAKFREKLIGRRIALALNIKGKTNDQIQEAMRGSIASDNGRGFFSTYLALSTNLDSEIPDGLLAEEKFFLEYFLGFPLNQAASPFLKDLGQQLNKIKTEYEQANLVKKELPILIGNYEQVADALFRVVNLKEQLSFNADRDKLLHRLKKVLDGFMEKSKYYNAIRASQLHQIYTKIYPANGPG